LIFRCDDFRRHFDVLRHVFHAAADALMIRGAAISYMLMRDAFDAALIISIRCEMPLLRYY